MVKMLTAEYGSLENCPSVVRGKIVELEHVQMTPDLRDRLIFLQHLTITTSFQVHKRLESSLYFYSVLDYSLLYFVQ